MPFTQLSSSTSSIDFWYTRVDSLWVQRQRAGLAFGVLLTDVITVTSEQQTQYKTNKLGTKQLQNSGESSEGLFLSPQVVPPAAPLGTHITTLLITESIISWEIALTPSPKCALPLRVFHTLMCPQQMSTEEPTPKSLMWSQCTWRSIAIRFLCWKTRKWM